MKHNMCSMVWVRHNGAPVRPARRRLCLSGLKRQDNDLIVIESPGAAASFKRNFEADSPAARLWRLARSSRRTCV